MKPLRFFMLMAISALFTLGTVSLPSTIVVAQEAEEEKKPRKRKRPDDFNRSIQYRSVIGDNVLAVGPFSIAMFVNGQNLEGQIRVAVVAEPDTDMSTLQTSKEAIYGILYPLILQLYEDGRPTTQGLLDFKESAKERLTARFTDPINDVFIVQIY